MAIAGAERLLLVRDERGPKVGIRGGAVDVRNSIPDLSQEVRLLVGRQIRCPLRPTRRLNDQRPVKQARFVGQD